MILRLLDFDKNKLVIPSREEIYHHEEFRLNIVEDSLRYKVLLALFCERELSALPQVVERIHIFFVQDIADVVQLLGPRLLLNNLWLYRNRRVNSFKSIQLGNLVVKHVVMA